MPSFLVNCACGRVLLHDAVPRESNGMLHRENGEFDHCVTLKLLNRDKEPEMEYTTYVRKPFIVQAVEITRENIEEVAKHVGDLRQKEDGTPYILVDRRLVPSVDRVFPGYFLTRMGENFRCYSAKVFREQFTPKTAEVQPWLDFLDANKPDAAVAAPTA